MRIFVVGLNCGDVVQREILFFYVGAFALMHLRAWRKATLFAAALLPILFLANTYFFKKHGQTAIAG